MVHIKQVWQTNSSDPENASQLTQIRRWWTALGGQVVMWQQRLLTQDDDAADLDWSEPQRFDETFSIQNPDLRGITLYWQQPEKPERNITVRKLELYPFQQRLYIFPQTQPGLVIRVTLPTVVYQTLKLTLSNCHYSPDELRLTLQDDAQHLEAQVQLSPAMVQQLKHQLL